MTALQTLAPEAITLRIATVRGQRVIVDPGDFMLTLTAEEFGVLRSEVATSNDQCPGSGGRRYAARVFTEHGALMEGEGVGGKRQSLTKT